MLCSKFGCHTAIAKVLFIWCNPTASLKSQYFLCFANVCGCHHKQHKAQCSNKCLFYGHCQTIYGLMPEYYQQPRLKLSQPQVHETQDTYIISFSPHTEMLELKIQAINSSRFFFWRTWNRKEEKSIGMKVGAEFVENSRHERISVCLQRGSRWGGKWESGKSYFVAGHSVLTFLKLERHLDLIYNNCLMMLDIFSLNSIIVKRSQRCWCFTVTKHPQQT